MDLVVYMKMHQSGTRPVYSPKMLFFKRHFNHLLLIHKDFNKEMLRNKIVCSVFFICVCHYQKNTTRTSYNHQKHNFLSKWVLKLQKIIGLVKKNSTDQIKGDFQSQTMVACLLYSEPGSACLPRERS